MTTTPAATLTARLALHAICCARYHGIVPPDQAEPAPSGEYRCLDWHACAYRRAQHRRIADELRAGSDDAGREVAAWAAAAANAQQGGALL